MTSISAGRRPITWLLACAFGAASGAAPAADLQGWQLADGGYDVARIAALDAQIEADVYKEINSIIVVRDGKLLVERYYNGADRETIHNVRSVGKTFASALVGIAMAGGYIEDLDRPLSDYYELQAYENYSPKKAAVTLRQLLTMTSAFEGDDSVADSPGNEEYMYPQPDWVEWTLDLPMAEDREPGEQWRYFTAGVVVLGDILNRTVPGGLEAYADARLFAPLGIRDYEWQHTPQRVANTAGGIQLTPLGFARFGQLYADGGRAAGRQLIPAAFVADSLRSHVATTVPGNTYGYLWWRKTYNVAAKELPVAYCTGNGGNKIFVFDEQPLVIVVTASAYGRRYMHSQVDELMTEYVLPAVLPRED